MKLAIELTQPQGERLAAIAQRLNVTVEELGAAAIRDLLAEPEPDFLKAATRVLEKNRELYERLR